VIVDTSVLVLVEKKKLQALDAVADLLASGRLTVSTVTAHELLRSPTLPAAWRSFWLDFVAAVEVAPVDLEAAEAAASIWAEARARDANRRLDVGDVLIAGTAVAMGLECLTDDDGLAELIDARLLRPS
jgi:predicted nucleic acid-binding protein